MADNKWYFGVLLCDKEVEMDLILLWKNYGYVF